MSRWQIWKQRLRSLRRETYALLLACRDERTPWYAKLTAGVVVAYALSPIDLIPDFIPVLGMLDDVVLIPLGIMLVRRLVPAAVMNDCRDRARTAFEREPPVVRVGVVLVVTLWVVFACLSIALIQGWSR